MRNLTLALDEALLEQGRALAEKRKTSLNALIRSLLALEVEQDDRITEAKAGLKRLMEEAPLDLGSDFKWNRNEIYAEREDRMLSRLERHSLRGFGEET